MNNYYDTVDVENEALYLKIAEMTAYTMEHRSRFSFHDAVEFDKNYVNELLNKETEDPEKTEAIKYMIANIVGRLSYQLEDSNETAKSWDDFIRERLGKQYDKLMSEWLMQKHNEFFQRVGMPEEMKPSSIYLFKGKEDE